MPSSLDWIVSKDPTVFLVQTSLAMMTADLHDQVSTCNCYGLVWLLMCIKYITRELWPSLDTKLYDHSGTLINAGFASWRVRPHFDWTWSSSPPTRSSSPPTRLWSLPSRWSFKFNREFFWNESGPNISIVKRNRQPLTRLTQTCERSQLTLWTWKN